MMGAEVQNSRIGEDDLEDCDALQGGFVLGREVFGNGVVVGGGDVADLAGGVDVGEAGFRGGLAVWLCRLDLCCWWSRNRGILR